MNAINLTIEDKFAIGLLVFMCGFFVAWTRVLYWEGVRRDLEGLRVHCQLMALFCVSAIMFSSALGFNLSARCVRVIQKQENQIQTLTASKSEEVQSKKSLISYSIQDSKGNTYAWDELGKGKDWEYTTVGISKNCIREPETEVNSGTNNLLGTKECSAGDTCDVASRFNHIAGKNDGFKTVRRSSLPGRTF